MVIVSNVNCGYLDMSVNFMLSVQRESGARVCVRRPCVRVATETTRVLYAYS